MKKQRKVVRLLIPLLALASWISGIILMPAPLQLVSAQVANASWTITGSMKTNRYLHTATLLPDGKVLVVGGETVSCSPRCYFPGVNSAELYDPETGAWGQTGSLIQARAVHSATLLPSGQVLVAGGYNNLVGGSYNILQSTELYDPAIGNWRTAGSFVAIRGSNSATLLANGKVLAIGSSDPRNVAFNTAELFDAASGTWSLTSAPQSGGITTLLPNGKVLAVRGTFAELYDPTTERWESTGRLNAVNADTATLLQNGKVLVTGLPDNSTNPAGSELYDPATGTWSVTGNLSTIFWSGPTLLLPNGRVLMEGGSDAWGNSLNNVELYDPTTGVWSPTSGLVRSRQLHTGTLLRNGKVLVAGGAIGNLYDDGPQPVNSAELYTSPNLNPNQIDDAQFFVHQHYRDFLNREPDADGLGFWTNEITSCGVDSRCIEVKRINDSASFFLSIEFRETGYLVYRMYEASYGNLPNAPVPLRISEFLPDTQEIGQGVIVRQIGWEQKLESNKQAFAAEFVQRSRFVSAYPMSMSSEQFVDALFANAGVVPSANDRTAALKEFAFAATTSDLAARGRALRRVAENSTLARQEFNRAFVLMQYFGYLRRNPNDAPETTLDYQGYNFWLNKLDGLKGNYIDAEMIKAFLSSNEYRQRFAH